MALTYGFYNSQNGDRRYNAVQMSSIFDGIIRDGVLQHVGTAMMVKANTGMLVNVGIGRAWFNHTWTLNDALLPLTVPVSEVILNRIDAVVLDVDSRDGVRANSIKIVKGTPASNPARPSMVKTNDRWQYPLAYIRVNSGVSTINQADITNCVGTSETPFVTAPLEKMSIDALVAQWGNQWKVFYEKETKDMTATNAFWKQQWSTWFLAQTAATQEAILSWEDQWNTFFGLQTSDMETTNAFWKQQWAAWFNSYVNHNTSESADQRERNQQLFDDWFAQLQIILDGDVVANLTNRLLELQKRTETLERFSGDLTKEHAIYYKLSDNGYRSYSNILDSSGNAILDSNTDPIVGRAYSSEFILDSNGEPIETRVIFAIK